MTTKSQIDVIIFDAPSGNVRGMVTALMPIKGKMTRTAHAILLVAKPPKVTIYVPTKLPLEQIEAVAETLAAFAAKVRECEQGQ